MLVMWSDRKQLLWQDETREGFGCGRVDLFHFPQRPSDSKDVMFPVKARQRTSEGSSWVSTDPGSEPGSHL